MKTELTDRQKEILKFIQEHVQKNGYPPTFREIGKGFGISSTFGVKRHLDALVKKGYITTSNNISRGLTLTGFNSPKAGDEQDAAEIQRLEDTVSLPIIGRVAAGYPVWATENIEGNITMDSSMFKNAEGCFALRVKGDSMIDAGIFEGDLVIVSPQNKVQNGEIVIALLGDEVTVKRFQKTGDEIRLIPENSNYQPIIVKYLEDFSIIGKVVGVMRWYN